MITKAQLAQAQSAKQKLVLTKAILAAKKPAKKIEEDIPLAIKVGWYTTSAVLGIKNTIVKGAMGVIHTGQEIAQGASARANID